MLSKMLLRIKPHFYTILLLSLSSTLNGEHAERPHIVIIMADDMGFDDISFRGSNHFLTPNIDALAYSGVILNNLYTPAMCTPSRAALLTGKYPINTGMQHYVIPNDQPWGLPLDQVTMAQIFQQNGYFTSLFGKWHLGMFRKAYTPTLRGFDKHFGYLGAYVDYYDQTLLEADKNFSRGHDFRDNLAVSHTHVGQYVTDTLSEAAVDLINKHNVSQKPLFMILSHLAPHSGNDDKPLQAPEEEIQKFAYINNVDRRTYAAMVAVLDKSVGQIVEALSAKQILNNTIILFLSDNGGPTVGMHSTTASNYPLRGQKNSPWEGGLRSSAAIWSAQFEKLGTVWKQQIYIADLLPTLAAAAGIELQPNANIDGLNLWSALKYGYESVEREIVHNIDDIFSYVSYVKGKWKFVNGTTDKGVHDGWLSLRANNSEIDPRASHYAEHIRNTTVWQHLSSCNANYMESNITKLRLMAEIKCKFEMNAAVNTPCNPLTSPCFFDIEDDPCEQDNVYEKYKNSKIMQEILERIAYLRQHAKSPNNQPSDPYCNPRYYHNEWTWWQDERDSGASLQKQYSMTLLIGLLVLSFNLL